MLPPAVPHYEYSINIAEHQFVDAKNTAYLFMDQLQGWCTHFKAAILFDLVLQNPVKKIVEIGVFGGKSLVPMAVALKAKNQGQIIGIDPWESAESVKYMLEAKNINWWQSIDHEGIRKDLEEKIKQFGLSNYIELWVTTSEAAPIIEEIDLLHIDGNHSEESSLSDILKWGPLVRNGGLIVVDDLDWTEQGRITTAKAVEWLNENCQKLMEFHEDNSWGIWRK